MIFTSYQTLFIKLFTNKCVCVCAYFNYIINDVLVKLSSCISLVVYVPALMRLW